MKSAEIDVMHQILMKILRRATKLRILKKRFRRSDDRVSKLINLGSLSRRLLSGCQVVDPVLGAECYSVNNTDKSLLSFSLLSSKSEEEDGE